MDYNLAMDDHLLSVFTAFKRGELKETSTVLIQNLLRLYHPPHITSVAQLKAVGAEDPSAMQQLASVGLTSQAAGELVERTHYKILLSVDQSQYPAVRVYEDASQDSVASQFVMSLKPGENRKKAHDWLRALLAEATNVTVVDGYLCDGQTGNLKPNAKKFFKLFPSHGLSIFLSRAKQPAISGLKQMCGNWTVKINTSPRYQNAHDRYLLIDGKMEVVITSGVDYLFDTGKECTLLVRKVTH